MGDGTVHDQVKLGLLSQLQDAAEYHWLDFKTVIVTVPIRYESKDIELYFAHVIRLVENHQHLV